MVYISLKIKATTFFQVITTSIKFLQEDQNTKIKQKISTILYLSL